MANGLLMLILICCCSRPALAATVAYPVPPAPATSLTGRALAASLSSGAPLRGLVPDRPRRTAQPASTSLDRLPVQRTHPADPVLRDTGQLVANPVHLVAFGSTGPARSPARG